MEAVRRGINGKRLFTPDFKREQVSRVVRGEVTAAELGRELGIAPALVRRWKHLIDSGAKMAVSANEDLVPVSVLRAAEQRIRQLERALGRKTMENEILLAAQAEVKERPSFYGVSKP